MRKVTIGDKVVSDNTPKTIFPSLVYEFCPEKDQVLNVKDFSHDVRTDKMEERDYELTLTLRTSRRLGNVFNMSCFYQKPMYSLEGGPAMMLPLDHECKYDWLSYRTPLWKEFIYSLCDRVYKNHHTDEDLEALSILLVDYSVCNPFMSILRHDGRMAVSDSVWRADDLKTFCKELSFFLDRNFERANLDEVRPPMNVSKGLGPNKRYPDGTPVDRSKLFYIPQDKWTSVPNNLVRYNYGPVKEAWIRSGRVQENLEYFLENCDRYDEPKIYERAFLMEACSAHTEAYRGNNADTPILSFKDSFKETMGKGYKKDRDWCFEVPGGMFLSGVYDDKAFETEQRKHYKDFTETSLKKRPMFPGPNASFAMPFIMLFRCLLKETEDGGTGFPSNREVVLSRYDRNFKHFVGWNNFFISFDRRTSEQFITDNFDKVLQMFTPKLRRIIKGLSVSTVPSLRGPRVVNGALTSGSAETTFLNVVVGLFENALLISTLFNEKFDKIIRQQLDCIFNEKDCYMVNDQIAIVPNLGTDDQLICIFTKDKTFEQFQKEHEKQLQEYADQRSLKIELTTSVTTFGMHFTPFKCEVSKVLGLSKLFLVEKEKNGDFVALKYSERLKLLDDYYDDICATMRQFGFGNPATYLKGRANAFKIIESFGFPVGELLDVEHSPSQKIVFGDSLKDTRFTDLLADKKYPLEDVEKLYSIFTNYFKGGVNA